MSLTTISVTVSWLPIGSMITAGMQVSPEGIGFPRISLGIARRLATVSRNMMPANRGRKRVLVIVMIKILLIIIMIMMTTGIMIMLLMMTMITVMIIQNRGIIILVIMIMIVPL